MQLISYDLLLNAFDLPSSAFSDLNYTLIFFKPYLLIFEYTGFNQILNSMFNQSEIIQKLFFCYFDFLFSLLMDL